MISQMIKENKTQKQVITKRLIEAIDKPYYHFKDDYNFYNDRECDEYKYHEKLREDLDIARRSIYTAMICVIDEMKILLEPLKIKEDKCKKQDYNKAYRLKKKEEQYLGYSV